MKKRKDFHQHQWESCPFHLPHPRSPEPSRERRRWDLLDPSHHLRRLQNCLQHLEMEETEVSWTQARRICLLLRLLPKMMTPHRQER